MTIPRLTISTLERAMALPADQWPGKCYQIASRLVEAGLAPGGRAVYGHWRGLVSAACSVRAFYITSRSVGFCQHGWVSMPDGSVIDPTRWVFEAEEPYIYHGKPEPLECLDYDEDDNDYDYCQCGHVKDDHRRGFFQPCMVCTWPYDEGGNVWREGLKQPWPLVNAGRQRKLKLSDDALLVVRALTGDDRVDTGIFTTDQLLWLANTDPKMFGACAREIYKALDDAKCGSFIPFDNYEMIMKEKKHAR